VGNELIRKDVCAEAMRLCYLLCEHPLSGTAASFALLSLMCFQASRFDSRTDAHNEIILLEQQDRSLWNQDLIARGYEYLSKSSQGSQFSVYHIESAIAAEHCLSARFDATNWERMLDLYDLLLTKKSTATVILNRSIILAQLRQTDLAIASIEQIPGIEGILKTQYIFNAVLGDLYLQQAKFGKARSYLLQAMELTSSEMEKNLMAKKIQKIEHRQLD